MTGLVNKVGSEARRNGSNVKRFIPCGDAPILVVIV